MTSTALQTVNVEFYIGEESRTWHTMVYPVEIRQEDTGVPFEDIAYHRFGAYLDAHHIRTVFYGIYHYNVEDLLP